MRKAGGIVAIIAGVFALPTALFTLLVGGASVAFESPDAQTVLWLGWGGIAFSFLTIVLGAVCLSARTRLPGLLLVLCSVAGAVLGGTFVALFMALAFVGGVLALLARPEPKAAPTAAS